MTKPTLEQISDRLRPPLLSPTGSNEVGTDTEDQESQVVVTLEQLRPYDRNPRFIRNPLYQDIKASIRERGLDQAFSITRRPGELHFIILNGGNTRLAILNELWKETRDDRYFRLSCRYRPWQSEAHAVLGHLAESDLHGQLAFIERALAVVSVKALLETETAPLSQRDLAQALSAGGYPVSQSQISRMFDTVQHLYPAIPQALSSGLAKVEIERLLQLRRRITLVWNRRLKPIEELDSLWQQALFDCDKLAAEFDWQEVHPALLARMAQALGISSRLMELELHQATSPSPPVVPPQAAPSASHPDNEESIPDTVEPPIALLSPEIPRRTPLAKALSGNGTEELQGDDPPGPDGQMLMSNAHSSASEDTRSSLPAITALLDAAVSMSPMQLRQGITQRAQALAESVGLSEFVAASDDFIGFVVDWETARAPNDQALAVQLLLTTLIGAEHDLEPSLQQALPVTLISQLLVGWPPGAQAVLPELQALSGSQLQLFIHLLMLARRLIEVNRPTPF